MPHRISSHAVTLVTLSSLILCLSTLMLVTPKKDFSESENRYLATIKSPKIENIANGSFFESITDFYSDHFPFRDKLISLKAISELALFKGENNGIIFGKKGYLIPDGEYEDYTLAQKNLFAISQYREKTNAIISIAPRSVDVMTSALPQGYQGKHKELQNILNTNMPDHVSLLKTLKSSADNSEYVWYKTDHHWTTDGAYLAYTELSGALGFTPYPKEYFDIVSVSEDFLGTSHSKSGALSKDADKIKLYRYDEDENVRVTVAESEETIPLYDFDKLSTKDKYAVFLGDNYSRLHITDGTKDKPRMLLIKDSYANSLIPFLALHYELDVIDPRYYEKSLSDASENADVILILLGIDTIATTPLTFMPF